MIYVFLICSVNSSKCLKFYNVIVYVGLHWLCICAQRLCIIINNVHAFVHVRLDAGTNITDNSQ